MNTREAAVDTVSLSKSYDDAVVVDSIDLSVPRHSIFGFLGPNGAGKTTTMKMLLGLIQPTSGSGSVFGLDIVADSSEVRRRIGYLPQEPRFYPHMTARETLRFAVGFFFSGPPEGIEKRIDEVLELVGISDKADRPINTLSGGETQRLGLAQAQIHQPELLILDEPAAALDPLGRRDVLSILDRFRSTSTVFYSTHILDDVQRVSDMVCILNKGRIIRQGPLNEVLAADSGSTFTVEIDGDVDRAQGALSNQSWVDEVVVDRVDGLVQLRIRVNDADAAEARLQRVLLEDENLIVKQFSKHSANLEEVFVDLVQEGSEDD